MNNDEITENYMVQVRIIKEMTFRDIAESIVVQTKKSRPESIVLHQIYRPSKNPEEKEIEQEI